MKHVRSDNIITGRVQPYTQKTHEFYNSMSVEAALSVISSLIPASWLTGKLVILSGGVTTGTNPGARTATAGWAFYNGEIYEIDAASFSTTGSQIGVWSIVETNLNIKFSDNNSYPVLQTKKIAFAAGLTGTGLFDETSSNVIRAFETVTAIPSQSGSPTSTLTIVSFEVKRHGALVSLFISGSITVSSGDATVLSSGAGFIQWTLTLPPNCVPDRSVVGTGVAFASVSSSPYKAAQVYSDKLSSTTISLRLTATQTVASGDNFTFVLNASYLTDI